PHPPRRRRRAALQGRLRASATCGWIPGMRSRAAVALILAFAWHLIVPGGAWSSARADIAHLQRANSTDDGTTSWVPRAERGEALGQRAAPGPLRSTDVRVASGSGPGVFLAGLRRDAPPHRPRSYPARRRLLRRISTARDDGPA